MELESSEIQNYKLYVCLFKMWMLIEYFLAETVVPPQGTRPNHERNEGLLMHREQDQGKDGILVRINL